MAGHFLAFVGRRMEHLSENKRARLQYNIHTALRRAERWEHSNSDSSGDSESNSNRDHTQDKD